MKRYRVPVVIEKDTDGYFAFCPEFQGCYIPRVIVTMKYWKTLKTLSAYI
ncbi:MAG: type II toxin-antitoxin system HicB family antitoxin [Halobacteriota archaeon]|nr:type II toxin-antitoxin system HicB family antitoxin [Halobacteriota archaeon]